MVMFPPRKKGPIGRLVVMYVDCRTRVEKQEHQLGSVSARVTITKGDPFQGRIRFLLIPCQVSSLLSPVASRWRNREAPF